MCPAEQPVARPSGQLPSDERIRGRITSAVRRNCPVWLAPQVEDIVQNVLVKLVKRSRRSEGDPVYSSLYLEKTVYGAVVDEIRRACRRREQRLADEESMERIPSPQANPEGRTWSAEVARGIHTCLDNLVRTRRLAVILYLQGCTVPQAALHLRWSAKKTENLVYRGLADLRRCLSERGIAP